MGPNNIVMAWSKDGKKIVYRNRTGDGFPGKLWTISPQGGMPEQIPLPEGGFCSYSPDGKKINGVGVTPDKAVELSKTEDNQLKIAIDLLKAE